MDFGGGWELRSGPGGVGDVDDEWRKAWGAWDGVAATGAGAGACAWTELKPPDPDLLVSAAGVTTVAPSLLPTSPLLALLGALTRPLSAAVVAVATVLTPVPSLTPAATAPKKGDPRSGTAWVCSTRLESISSLFLGSGRCFKVLHTPVLSFRTPLEQVF